MPTPPFLSGSLGHLDAPRVTLPATVVVSRRRWVGLPATDLAQTLDSGAYAQQVRADRAGAGRREVTAVQTFLVDRRYVTPGAHSPESILATLNRAWSTHLAGRGHESQLQ